MRLIALLAATATAGVALLGSTGIAQATGTDESGTVTLKRASVEAHGLTLKYKVSCPAASTSYLDVTAAQVQSSSVVQRAAATEVACTGALQKVTVVVPGSWAAGTAVVDAIVAADRETGNWRSVETVTADLDGTAKAALAPVRKNDAPVAHGPPGADAAMPATVEVTRVRVVGNGAALAVTVKAVCATGSAADALVTVDGVGSTLLRSADALACTGAVQKFTSVVLAGRGAPVALGALTIDVVLANGECEIGCFATGTTTIA